MNMQCVLAKSHAGEYISLAEFELKHPASTSRFIILLQETLHELGQRNVNVDLESRFDCRVQDDGELWIHYTRHSRDTVLRIPEEHWVHTKNDKSDTIISSLVWAMSVTFGAGFSER